MGHPGHMYNDKTPKWEMPAVVILVIFAAMAITWLIMYRLEREPTPRPYPNKIGEEEVVSERIYKKRE